MNRGAAKGWRFRGCWRQWLATALLLVAFAPLALQAGAYAMPAGHMIHAQSGMAAGIDQNCDHPQAGAGCVQVISGDQDGSGASGPGPQNDCCNQVCTITAVLPEGARADPPFGGEALHRRWTDRLGRTPEGILRPPRSSAAA